MSIRRIESDNKSDFLRYSPGMTYVIGAVTLIGLAVLGGASLSAFGPRRDMSGYPGSYVFGNDSYNDLVRAYTRSVCEHQPIQFTGDPIFDLEDIDLPKYRSHQLYFSEHCPEQLEVFKYAEEIATVAQYFPLHIDEIMEEAEKCHSQVGDTPILYSLKKYSGKFDVQLAFDVVERNTLPYWNFLCLMGGRRFDEEAWEGRFPLDQYQDKAKDYIVQKANFTTTFQYGKDQIRYGAFMHQSALIGAAHIEQGYSFNQLVSLLALRRNQIAMRDNTYSKQSFGCMILDQDYVTPCSPDSGYADLGESLQELIQTESPFIEKISDSRYQFQAPLPMKGGTVWVSHSSISLNKKMGVRHTKDPKTREMILEAVEEMYLKSLIEADPDRLTERLGEIFWWLCQAKPWERGDPSIAETIIKSVAVFKDNPLPGWKEGIVPWEEVMKTPDPLEFARNFHKLLSPLKV